MSKSDILESFFKIAQEKGLISEDAPEKAKKQLEKDPRWDSLSADDIAKLYNTKPKLPKGSEYKRNIYERAHPTPVIISPSYDRLHGLVENENERQDITLNILMKSKLTDGNMTKVRYAEKDLILSLVRLSNDLDNQNKEKLCALADACLLQVSSPMKKEGVTLLGAGVLAISSLIGALYLQQHMSFVSEGFERDYQKLIEEVNDLVNSSAFITGYQYTPAFKTSIAQFKGRLESFHETYTRIREVINEMEKPRSAKELMEFSKQPQAEAAVKAYKNMGEAFKQLKPYLDKVKENFSNQDFVSRQIQDKGILTSLVDKMHVFHGGKGLIANDFDDVVRALPAFEESTNKMVQQLQAAEKVEKSADEQLRAADEKSKEEKPVVPGKPGKPTVKTDIDDQVSELEAELGGGI